MNARSQTDFGGPEPTENRCATTHPAWCEPARCTADPAVLSRDGGRISDAGEHRSAPVPLALAGVFWLPAREGSAWLTEACAPWQCAPHLRVKVGDGELSMAADDAGRMLDVLSVLVASARAGEGVNR